MFLQGTAGDAKPSVIGKGLTKWRAGTWDDVQQSGQIVARETIAVLNKRLAPVEPLIRSAIEETRWPLQPTPPRGDFERKSRTRSSPRIAPTNIRYQWAAPAAPVARSRRIAAHLREHRRARPPARPGSATRRDGRRAGRRMGLSHRGFLRERRHLPAGLLRWPGDVPARFENASRGRLRGRQFTGNTASRPRWRPAWKTSFSARSRA